MKYCQILNFYREMVRNLEK